MLNTTWSVRGSVAVLAIALSGFALPVAMVLANRSAPAVLAAATLVALLAVALSGSWHELLQRHHAKLRRPVAVAALVFAAVAVSSLTWTVDRGATARSLVQTFLMVYVAFVAACALPLIGRPASGWILVAGVTVGTLLVIVEVMQGMRWHGWLGEQTFVFELKRSLIVLVLLFWPAAGFLASRGRTGWAIALGVVLLAATQLVGAGTAALGLIVGAIGFAGARFAPRRMLGAAMLFVALAFVTAPFTGILASHLFPGQALRLFVRTHAAERIPIWHAFGVRFFERLTLGYGFDASARVGATPRPAGSAADPAADAVIVGLHPHNSYLQVLVEGGLVGALAAATVFVAVFFALARLPHGRLPLRLALFLATTSMPLVGFGLWQTWWSASVASAIIWLMINDRTAGAGEKTRG
jgi:O-antigen ligase